MYPVRISHTLMMRRNRNISHTLSSRHLEQTVWYLLSSAALTMRKFWMQRRTMSVQSFISIRYLHRLRSVCFRFPRSLTRVLRRSTSSFPRSTTVSTMTVETSVNVTADRMRSVLLSVSLMTSSLKMTVQLQSVTVTLWSRYV